MKYFNFKRYKLSTMTRRLKGLLSYTFAFLKLINLKKIYNFFDDLGSILKITVKYLEY